MKRPVGVSKDSLVQSLSAELFSPYTWTCDEFLSSLSVQLCISEDSSLEAFQVSIDLNLSFDSWMESIPT